MSQFDTPFAQAVKSLGETPESVTEALRAKGIKGYRCRASCCPVANYLKACGFPEVSIGSRALRFSGPTASDSDEQVSLPSGVRDWISQFDDGGYPEFYQE